MRIRSPHRCIMLTGIMLSLSFCTCGKRYTYKVPVIAAEAEKPMENKVWSNAKKGG